MSRPLEGERCNAGRSRAFRAAFPNPDTLGSMRALVQRVGSAAVDVGGERVGAIGAGLCALVGVTHTDTASQADQLADKLWYLRVLPDAAGVMNVALADIPDPQILVVSQFTLYGDTRKGRRPSWIDAARPEHAEPLIERVVARLQALGATVATGRFRTEMQVTLVNDGPVTLMLEV